MPSSARSRPSLARLYPIPRLIAPPRARPPLRQHAIRRPCRKRHHRQQQSPSQPAQLRPRPPARYWAGTSARNPNWLHAELVWSSRIPISTRTRRSGLISGPPWRNLLVSAGHLIYVLTASRRLPITRARRIPNAFPCARIARFAPSLIPVQPAANRAGPLFKRRTVARSSLLGALCTALRAALCGCLLLRLRVVLRTRLFSSVCAALFIRLCVGWFQRPGSAPILSRIALA
jgi:hypothetical protein